MDIISLILNLILGSLFFVLLRYAHRRWKPVPWYIWGLWGIGLVAKLAVAIFPETFR